MRWVGNVACVGKMIGVYRVSVVKPEGKRALGSPRHRLEYNMKMDLQEIKWRGWNELIWLRIGIGGGCLGMQ